MLERVRYWHSSVRKHLFMTQSHSHFQFALNFCLFLEIPKRWCFCKDFIKVKVKIGSEGERHRTLLILLLLKFSKKYNCCQCEIFWRYYINWRYYVNWENSGTIFFYLNLLLFPKIHLRTRILVKTIVSSNKEFYF